MAYGFLPDVVRLTSERKELLTFLNDGGWYRSLPGSVRAGTLVQLGELGFVKICRITKNPLESGGWALEFRITRRGRWLLRHKEATMVYRHNPKARNLLKRSISIAEAGV